MEHGRPKIFRFRSGSWKPALARIRCCVLLALVLPTLSAAGQTDSARPTSSLPEAPLPQPSIQPVASAANGKPCPQAAGAQTAPCPSPPPKKWLERFLTGPEVKPLTPMEKAHLAARNVLDPYNGLTILVDSAIAIGSDAHSPYGPGMKGFGRSVGVSYTQDMTGEFFGTFLISSVVHEDPHYHRLPKASIPRRVGNTVQQVVWAQGDNGKGMVNYAGLLGYAIGDGIANLYVPGRQTNLPASAQRYATGLASEPIDNLMTEFLPDVARHIHVRVVLIQRLINHVANTGATSP